MKALCRYLRLYLVSALYSYRAMYAWQGLAPYVSGKVIYPLAQMLLFYYIGKLAGIADPVYIVIGNILFLPATNGISGLSMTISGERSFRTLPYLIASPAPRGPLVLGRSLVHIMDGLLSTIVALVLGVLVFHVDLSRANPWLTALCILTISFTSCGFGFILGSLSLRTREAWTVTTVLYLALLIFSGVNFPVEVLPTALQWVARGIPLTRGIAAARGAMAGADWSSIQALLAGEILVGMIYIGAGYLLFSWFEKLSLVDGQIEAM